MVNSNASSKQKFLILIDFSKSSYLALKYAISLAKIIEAKLELLYVAKPQDIEDSDNPSVVLRAVDIAAGKAESQLQSIKEMVESEDISVDYHNVIGDLTLKANLYIELYKPSLVVIGKRKSNDNHRSEITEYLLYQYVGNLVIVGKDSVINTETIISLECNSETLYNYNSSILFWLNYKTKEPLRVFVNRRKRATEKFSFPDNWQKMADSDYRICYRDNQSFSLAKSIINHISTEKTDLICMGRKNANKSLFSKLFNQTNTTIDVINNAHIPVLILGKQ